MRTTILDDLFAEAQTCTGLKRKCALVREALTALTEREGARRLAHMGGIAPDVVAPPRRRSDPA